MSRANHATGRIQTYRLKEFVTVHGISQDSISVGWEKVFVFRHGGDLVNLHGSSGSTARGANWFRSYCSVTGTAALTLSLAGDGGEERERRDER